MLATQLATWAIHAAHVPSLAAGRLPAGQWLLGGNWDESSWGGEPPAASWVDACTQDTPLWLHRMDGHMGLANSAALRLAGVSRATPDPAGGVIARWAGTGMAHLFR